MSTAPPPPPPAPVRRQWTGIAVAAVVALATFAVGVAVGRAGDDDADEDRTVSTEIAPAPPPGGTDGGPTSTSPPATESGPTTIPPPGPPVPIITLHDALYPPDITSLRSLLDKFGFPEWWPMPDTLAPDTARFPTVQEIAASDTVYEPGTTDANGNAEVRTEWLVDAPDVATAEAAFLPRIPADRYDIQAGIESRDETVVDGVAEVTFSFRASDPELDESIYVAISDGVDTESGERVGTTVRVGLTTYDYERPDPVPIGSAPAKQWLGQAPAAPEMVWNKTQFSVQGGLNPFGPVDPSGQYDATWQVRGRDVDATVAFLSDPANFRGDLKLVSTGQFGSAELWSQPMGYQGFLGEYTMLTAAPDEVTHLYLTFQLE